MRGLLLGAILASAACRPPEAKVTGESPEVRCRSIFLASEDRAMREENLAPGRQLVTIEWIARTKAGQRDSLRRAVDSATLAEAAAQYPAWNPEKGSMEGLAAMYALVYDSTHLLLGPPPPRPSEIAWHAENCWEGKPR